MATFRDAAAHQQKRGSDPGKRPFFRPSASFSFTLERLFAPAGATVRSSGRGRSLLLPRSALMRREEEPRKADCPGCHGDFPQNAAKHGNFYANSDIKKGVNHPKEARLAFVLCEY